MYVYGMFVFMFVGVCRKFVVVKDSVFSLGVLK